MKFALELIVPEKLLHPGGRAASDSKHEASQNVATSLEAAEAVQRGKARRIIEELDHGQFGGPSFGPQTIDLMSKALENAEASLPEPASDQQLRLIAATILKVAGDGERDPIRLKAAAMSALGSALGSVAGNADGQPLST
ncbi:hypothetical protein [Bradyrhizobium sp. AZCC 1610]|uniref:hypothetical protein n=1 Tax=Bradyrhizobium sp. AZCC 1610 TaxID=3117020 RepID=UPI002FEF29F3